MCVCAFEHSFVVSFVNVCWLVPDVSQLPEHRPIWNKCVQIWDTVRRVHVDVRFSLSPACTGLLKRRKAYSKMCSPRGGMVSAEPLCRLALSPSPEALIPRIRRQLTYAPYDVFEICFSTISLPRPSYFSFYFALFFFIFQSGCCVC